MSAVLREGTPSKDGGCNFCRGPNHHGTVLVIKSDDEGCSLEARFCLPCFLGAVSQIQEARQKHKVV